MAFSAVDCRGEIGYGLLVLQVAGKPDALLLVICEKAQQVRNGRLPEC
jgi:hypothetical protein